MLAATAANGIEIVWSGDTPLALIGMALLTVIVAVAFFAQQQASTPRSLRAPATINRSGPEAERIARRRLLEARGLQPPPQFENARERRQWLRRQGNPVDVLIAADEPAVDATRGTVLDRSRGGLCLSAHGPAPVGTILKVRAAHAPEVDAWVSVEVRHCQERDGSWQLGCKFEQKLSWSELLLFG